MEMHNRQLCFKTYSNLIFHWILASIINIKSGLNSYLSSTFRSSLGSLLLIPIFLILPLMFSGCDAVGDRDALAIPIFEYNESRKVTIVGTTRGRLGSGSHPYYKLSGVNVFAFVNGHQILSTTGTEGNWTLPDIPLRPSIDGNGGDDLPNIVVYVERAGWEYDGDGGTLGVQNWIEVKVDAHQEDGAKNFHVDLGVLTLEQISIKVTSSLLKPNNSGNIDDIWLSAGTYGDTAAERDEVYMRSTDGSITLTFNMVMDTGYSRNFIEFYASNGSAVAHSDSWDATGTIYTITPTGMVADNDDNTQYYLSIARPVRGYNSQAIDTKHELSGVNFQFNYLSASRNNLLSSQAPTLYPQAEGYTNYIFDRDATKIRKIRLVAGTNVTDTIALEKDFCLRYTIISNAESHIIYWRNLKDNQAGIWTDVTAEFQAGSGELGDGTAYSCVDIIAAPIIDLMGADDLLSSGEVIQFVVVAVDSDGNESSINTVTSPLSISDTSKPYLSSTPPGPAYSKTGVTGQRDELFSTTPTGKVSLIFNEIMDTTNSSSKPVFAGLSGLFSSVTSSSGMYTSPTGYEALLTLNYIVPATTLAESADAGGSLLRLAAIGALQVGDQITVIDVLNQVSENLTIADMDSYSSTVTTGALGASYPSGSRVELYEGVGGGAGGLTYFTGLLSAVAYKSATTVTLGAGQGTRFFVGQSVDFYLDDEEAWTNSGVSRTIESIVTDTLSFTAPIGRNLASGTRIVESSVSAVEPLPRVASVLTPSGNILFDGGSAATTLAINNFDTIPDAQANVILATDVTGFNVSDLIVVGKTTLGTPGTLANDEANGQTVLDVGAGHLFLVGDQVKIVGDSVRVGLGAAHLTGDTLITIASATSFATAETITLEDDAVQTDLTATVAVNDLSISVASTAGLAIGQTININSGVDASETATITGIAFLVVTVTRPPTNFAHGVGAVVTRAALTEPIATDASSAATTITVVIAGLVNNYSPQGRVVLSRPTLVRSVTATGANTITVSVATTSAFPAGTAVKLLSFPETREITAINGRLMTLGANLSFPHRSGATVTKQAQAVLSVGANELNGLVLGDTVVCDSLPAPGGGEQAHADRFFGTIAAMDTANDRFTLTSSKTGLVTPTNTSCLSMGDAIILSGATDNNGNVIGTSGTLWGNKIDLSSVAASSPR